MPTIKVKDKGVWKSIGSAGGGIGAQPNWNQNDPTKEDYIKNRPFYEELNVWTTLLSTTQYGPFEFNSTFNAYMYEIKATYQLVVGNTYKITWDGAEYQCVAQDASAIMPDGVALGNCSAFGLDGNNEPFAIATDNRYIAYMSNTDGNHTVAIEELGTLVHKIDGKYLPEGMGYIEIIKDEIIPEDRFDGFAVMQEPLYAISIPFEFEPIIDGEYTVRWDGVDYTVPGVSISGVFCLGNTNYANMLPGGDIPFAVISPPGLEEVYFVTESTAEAHTVAISGPIKVVHKMDKDCLPEDAVTSVNGMTGDVWIDIPQLSENIVTSVNGMTGDVTIEAGGVGKAGVGENAEAFNGLNSWNAFGSYSHAEGEESYAVGQSSHAENQSVATGSYSHAEGVSDTYRGMSFSGNANSTTYIYYDLVPSVGIWLLYENRFAEIIEVNEEDNTFVVSEPLLDRDIIYPKLAYAKKLSSGAFGYASHAEGEQTSAKGLASHAEGGFSDAIGEYSHAEGWSSRARGQYSHAEGSNSLAIGDSSHSENYASAIGSGSHAENGAITYGTMSHAEGISYLDGEEIKRFSYEIINEDDLTTFKITYDFNNYFKNYIQIGYLVSFGTEISWFKVINFNESEKTFTIDAPFDGYFNTNTHYAYFYSGGIASGDYSHSEGIGTIAGSQSQHVQGRYNLIDSNDRYAHIVGNGDGLTNPERSNAHTLDWEGNAWFQGEVYVGGTSQDDADRLVKLSEINGSGGVTSWNNLTDKPFQYKTVYYEWNEDTEYETSVELPTNDTISKYVKISNDAPDSNFFLGKQYSARGFFSDNEADFDATISEQHLTPISDGAYAVVETTLVVTTDSVVFNGVTLTKGIWSASEYLDASFKYYWWKVYDPAVQLDESVIPDTIARVAQIPKFSYGTEDLIAGESELATGTLYFVYE